MILVPHKVVSLAESDSVGTDGKNIVANVTYQLFDATNTPILMYNDAFGNGGNTVKSTDSEGTLVVWVEPGIYQEQLGAGGTKRFISVGAGSQIGGVFNIDDYGAVADNATDNKVAIDEAIADLAANGGGTLLIPPNGIYRTSGNHTLTSNMAVVGEGYNSCLKGIYDPVGETTTPVFNYINPLRPAIGIENVSFLNVRIEGIWDEVYREIPSNSEVILVGVRNFTMIGCWLKNNTFGGLVLNQCVDAHVHSNWFIDSARDMCRLWNCDNSSVIDNAFYRNDDDCISINMAGFETVYGRPRQGILVQGNYMQDTGSIRIQSAKNCTIDGNVINLCKGGSSISLEGITTAEVRESNVHSVIISNNIITNTIERDLAFTETVAVSSNLRTAIKVNSGPSWDVSSLDFDESYDYFNTDSGAAGADPQRINEFVLITGNQVLRTLPAVANYSDWGYGKMFTRFKGLIRESTGLPYEDPIGYIVDGECDPQVQDFHLGCRSLEIRNGLHNSTISENFFGGSGLQCMQFRADTERPAQDLDLRNVTVRDNVFYNFGNYGIDLSNDYGSTSQDVTIDNNTFDADPFFKDSQRATDNGAFTGGWNEFAISFGIFATAVKGLRVTENTFKNCRTPYVFGGDKAFSYIAGNYLVGEPSLTDDPTMWSADNKGIGQYFPDMQGEATLIYERSDPRAADYGQKLEQQKLSFNSVALASGYYFKGQTIPDRSVSVEGGAVLFGWRRLTNGTGQVEGVDWSPIYATTSAQIPVWTYTGNSIDASSQSTRMRGIVNIGAGTFYTISNDSGNFRVYRYNNTTYDYDGISFPIAGFNEFIIDIMYDSSTGSRWVSGSPSFGVNEIREYSSSFVATGQTRSIAASGMANIGATRYAVVATNLVTYSDAFTTQTASVNLGVSNITGLSRDVAGTGLLFVTGGGDVYSCGADGSNVTLILQTGTDAQGVTTLDSKIYVCTQTEIREYELV